MFNGCEKRALTLAVLLPTDLFFCMLYASGKAIGDGAQLQHYGTPWKATKSMSGSEGSSGSSGEKRKALVKKSQPAAKGHFSDNSEDSLK